MAAVVLVTGGRKYNDPGQVDRYLTQLSPRIIIEGGAEGADRLARAWAFQHGVHCATVEALWSHHGKSAGPRRNRAMAMLKPDVVLAFPGGAGTAGMVSIARELGYHVIEVTP